MKINQSEFVMSVVAPEQYPKDGRPEIALCGRSNVGKSSFINKMLNRKSLAHTSSKPGKTRTLNFYLINQAFYLVDLPGYGFASVSKEEKAKWGPMMEAYFESRRPLRGAVLLIDARHGASKDDQLMAAYLQQMGIPTVVVATKLDKIPRGKWNEHRDAAREALGLPPEIPLILFSAETGEGRDEAWKRLQPYLSANA